MKLASWYKTVLLIWLVIALPGLVLAYGFSDGKIDTWFNIKGRYTSDVVVLLATWAMLICPLWLAPFGLRRKPIREVRDGTP